MRVSVLSFSVGYVVFGALSQLDDGRHMELIAVESRWADTYDSVAPFVKAPLPTTGSPVTRLSLLLSNMLAMIDGICLRRRPIKHRKVDL